MTKYPEVEISLIATFHSEGNIAHKTLQNIQQLVAPLKKEGIAYEVILHADNPDAATWEYLSSYNDKEHFRVFRNSFGNPSDSRNFCAQQSKGRFLVFIDGDDLYSPQWVIDGYHLLRKSSAPIVYHVEYDISFGRTEEAPRLWHMSDALTDDEDIAYMFTRNRWSAGTILPRQVALDFPYKASRKGFGYEDWVFNMDTRHAGIKHKVVPGSVKFYRVRAGSTYSLHGEDHAITAYSEMFSTPRIRELAKRFDAKTFPIKSPNTNQQRLLRLSQHAFDLGRHVVTALPYAGNYAERGLNHRSRRRGQKAFANLPQSVQDAWIAANQIDGEAWPDPLKLGKLWTYDSEFNDLTELYCRLVSQIRKNPDYLFLPPHLSVGGTEKVLTNYINAFAELHPEWHIVVLASLPANHPYKIPDNVDFVDFYGLIQGHSAFEIDFILSRFIVQTKVKRLHLIHNELAFSWAKDHLSLLAGNDYKLYISQFMDEYNQDPCLVVGFVDPWIRDLAPAITKILTDNAPFAAEIQHRLGLPAEKVVAHFQPIDSPDAKSTTSTNESPETSKNSDAIISVEKDNTPPQKPLRILWASRVSPQKRPDLLKQIVKKLNPTKNEDSAKYLIDAYGRTQKPYTSNFFADVAPTVTYQGTYNGIDSLDLASYDAFLYTSQTDGLPNVLLEIASAGLPIVASSVGGVSDIVNTETGYPVDMTDIDGYVKALQDIRDNPKKARAKAEKARKLVQARHTWDHFLNQVKRDID